MLKFNLLIISLMTVACSAGTISSPSDYNSTARQISMERYGKQSLCISNEMMSYTLCKQLTPVQQPNVYRSFFIYDNATAKVVYESRMQGEVDWYKGDTLKILEFKGVIENANDTNVRLISLSNILPRSK